MVLERILLNNFRSYTEREFTFSPDVTVITGHNGVGKTNLLEAIYVLYTGKSFRDSDADLVRYDEAWFRVSGEYGNHHREVRYQPMQTVRKTILLDDMIEKRFTYRHQLPIVLFEPDDMLMIHGSPSLRRAYLDGILIKTEPTYRAQLARYERALLQRNNILRQGLSLAALRDAVFVWDVALAEYGALVQAARMRLVGELNKTISEVYSKIAGKKQTASIHYAAKVRGDNQRLASALAHALEHDRFRGTTSVGPHRDDVELHINKQPAKQTASRGETRTLVLALKELELAHLSTMLEQTPLFLLDDVFSELDEKRQKTVLANMDGVQKIITTTHNSDKTNTTTIRLI